MFEFILNDSKVFSQENESLLDFLRENANLKSVKNGCAEGSCGACMVLIDGKATRACVVKTSKIVGKNILTVEGISDYEKDVYAYCFGKAGAVQCGFCIPGMVISSKGLIDVNNNPSLEEVKVAIKNNICRCTGYKKIEEAILMSAKMIREKSEIPSTEFKGLVGELMPRIDAKDKTLGTAIYVDDMVFPDMVFGSGLRAKYPRARVLSINIEKAKAHPECIDVILASDIKGARHIGHLVQDWPAIIAVGEETRYVGDTVALAVATTKKALKEVLALIEVEYEELKPLTSPVEALKEDAPKIHQSGNLLKKEILKRGDVDEAFKNAKYIVTHKYSTPFTEHAFLEPECAIAMPDDGGLLLYTSSQSIYDEKERLCIC